MKAPRLSHIWDRHPEDWYVEPEWTSARLFDVHEFDGIICDPACGSGRIIHEAHCKGYETEAYDIVRRTSAIPVFIADFLSKYDEPEPRFDNVVSNPPFKHCDSNADFIFIRRALAAAQFQVALLLPAKFQYGQKRGRFLRSTPLEFIYALTPRPSMPPGPVIEAGEAPGNGREDFAWFVWRHGYEGEPVARWIDRDEE